MATTMEKTRHPGIYKRGSRYVIVWRHRGKQHKQFFRTLAEAREAKGNRDGGDKRPLTKVRFGDYYAEWIDAYAGRTSRGFSETSRGLYRRAIDDNALPVWRSWRLSEIGPEDVRDLYARVRGRGGSTAQLRTLRAALSALFATAAEDGKLTTNPVRGVRIPNGESAEEPEQKAKGLTRKELRALLAVLPHDWRLFFEFLSVTGLRISEAVGLRWEHLDLGESPKVQVREQLYRGERKGLKSREGRRDVPLSPAMADKLLAHRRDHYDGALSPVFATTTGTPLDPHNVRRTVLRPAALALGYYEEVKGRDGKPRKRTTLGFHALRHSCASMLFERGRNVRQVSEWLGHADPAFTLRTYVHLMDEGVGSGLDLDDQVGNGWATQALQTPANAEGVDFAETAQ